jgi:type II secretory pathway pseudopilin PulG
LELLVVVAVIAILAALLFPVIGSMNAGAMQTRGINTLKALQQANFQYAADNDGWSVPVMKNDAEMKRTWWINNPEFLAFLDIEPGEKWPKSMLYPTSAVRNPADPPPDPARLFGYNYTTIETGFSTPGFSRSVKLASILNPSKTISFADAVDLQIRFLSADRWAGKEEYLIHAIAYRHPYGRTGVSPEKQRAAAAFWDGSVRMVTREQAVNDPELWNIIQN